MDDPPPAKDISAKIEFVERKAEEHMTQHLADMEVLNREVNQTFTFLAALMAAVFGYLLKLYEPGLAPSEQQWQWLAPVFGLAMFLAGCAAYLLWCGMLAKEVHHPGNIPSALLNKETEQCTVEELRHGELISLERRIAKNRERNLCTARALNRTRFAVLLSPLIFLAAWAVAELATA